jgi:hypothetical protein
MDDIAGGGAMLSLAEQEFGVIARLLNRASYDEVSGRKLHSALAEFGRLAGYGAYDSGRPGLAQRYNIDIAEILIRHTASIFCVACISRWNSTPRCPQWKIFWNEREIW